MPIRLTQMALAIATITALTACGSSGGNNSGNTKPAEPTGTINRDNFADYINVARTTHPILPRTDLPVGGYTLTFEATQSISDVDGTKFWDQACEDGTGKLAIIRLDQNDSSTTDIKGDYERKEYTGCTFYSPKYDGSFEHDGALELKITEHNVFTLPADSTVDVFTESETASVMSHDGYSLKNISADDMISLDGALTTLTQKVSEVDFFDPTKRNVKTIHQTTTDFMHINVDVVGLPRRDETYTHFTFAQNENALTLIGNVKTKVGNTTYDYSVNMPSPLNVTTEGGLSIYGNMTVNAGKSKLKVAFQGSRPASVELDSDGDGNVDFSGTLNLQ